jgi:O-antigen/teichoic acid export membrane protein
MREILKRLIKLTAGYSLVTLLGPLFTILLTPLYTKVLTPADYGVVDVVLTLTSLLIFLATLGLDQALNAYFFDEGKAHQRNAYTTALVSVGTFGLALATLLMLLATPLAEWLFKDPDRRYLFYLAAIIVAAGPVYTVTSTALRLRMGIRRVNALGLGYLFITAATNIVFVLILRMQAAGIVAANAVTQLSMASLGVALAWKPLRGQYSRNLFRPMLHTGLSLMPAGLSNILFMSIDRIILTQYVTQNNLGLYSIANKLASMGFVILSAAWMAWWPMALEMAARSDAPRVYARMFDYFIAASCWVSLAIGVFAPEILLLFTRALYLPAAGYTLALLTSGPINIMAGFFQIGLYARKKTGYVSLAYGSAAAVNIALNLLLDPVIGVWGAVIATVVATGVIAVVLFFPSQRLMPVPYNFRRISILMAAYVMLTLIALLSSESNTLVYKLGAPTVFLVLIVVVGVITPRHIQIVWQAARNRLGT